MNNIEHIYIHVPFCKKKCLYCDFYSLPVESNENLFEEYAEALTNELEFNSLYLNKNSVKTVYFGGGSPALLGVENLERVLGQLKQYIYDKTEITIEMNPGHFDKKNTVTQLKEIGFNRISIGVQSSIESLLKTICRTYSKDLLLKNVENILKHKMTLSLDFMFALPGQTKDDLYSELDFIQKLDAQHLSYYMFTPPNKDIWKDLPNESLIVEMFSILHNKLENMGYSHYEVSNFSKKGFECIHNTAYWERKSYLGIGAGAHGYFDDKKMRYWNFKDIKKYIDYENKMQDFEILSDKDQRNEEIMLGLRMLKKGVNIDLVNKSKLAELEKEKLIHIDNDAHVITVTEEGLPLLNSVITSLS